MENSDAAGMDQDTHLNQNQIREEFETVSTIVPYACSGSCDPRVPQCLVRGSEIDPKMSTDCIATTTEPVRASLLMKHMESLHFDYRTIVLKELGLFYSTWRAVKRYVLHTPDFSQEYEDMIRIIGEIHDAAWTLLRNANRFKYRFRVQDKLVRKFLASTPPFEKKKKSKKNPKRQANGKRNFVKLATWNAEVKEAFKILKETGYKGSFSLQKGKPVYDLILKLRKEKLEATSA